LKEYVIQFSGLNSGEYAFNFELGKRFFESLETEEFSDGSVKLTIFLQKSETMMVFDFDFDGAIQCVCDRCLGEITIPVKEKHALYVKFGVEYSEVDDEVIVLPEKEHQIDLTPFIYDFLMIAIPLQKTHEIDVNGKKCDENMIHLIEESQKKEEEIDPRWEQLKILKNNN